MNQGADFDRFARSYAQQISDALPAGFGEVDRYTQIKARHIIACIERNFPGRSDLRVLDNGCGVGLTDAYLSQRFPDIVGCDMSEVSLSFARKHNPNVKYVLSSDGRLPFKRESFDVAIAICVVHHVHPTQWQAFFTEMMQTLVPGGLLIIVEHNPWNPLTRLVVSRIEFDKDAVLVKPAKCLQIGKATGLASPEVQFIAFLPLSQKLWLSLERRLLSRIPLGAQYQFSAVKPRRS